MNIKSSSLQREYIPYPLQSNLQNSNSGSTHTKKIKIESVRSFEEYTHGKRNYFIHSHFDLNKHHAVQDDFIKRGLVFLTETANAKDENLVRCYCDFLRNYKLAFNKYFRVEQKNTVLTHLTNVIFNSEKKRTLFWNHLPADVFVDFFEIVSDMQLLNGGLYKDTQIKTTNLIKSVRFKMSHLILHGKLNLAHFYACFNAVNNIDLIRDYDRAQDRILLNRLIVGINEAPFLTSDAACQGYEELKYFACIIHAVSWKVSSKFTDKKSVVDLITHILKKEPYKIKNKIHSHEKKEYIKSHLMYLMGLANLVKIGMLNVAIVTEACRYLIKKIKCYPLNTKESLELMNALANLVRHGFILNKDIEFVLLNISTLMIKIVSELDERQISYLINNFSYFVSLNLSNKMLGQKANFILEQLIDRFIRMPNSFHGNICYEQLILGMLTRVKDQNELSTNLKLAIEKTTMLSLNHYHYLKERHILNLLAIHFLAFEKKWISQKELVSIVTNANEAFAFRFNELGYLSRYILALATQIKEQRLESVFLHLLNDLIQHLPENANGNTRAAILSTKILVHVGTLFTINYKVIISKLNHILHYINTDELINLTPEQKISFVVSLGSLGQSLSDISNLKFYIKTAMLEIENENFLQNLSLANLEELALGLMTLHCALRHASKNDSSINRYNLRINILLELIKEKCEEHNACLSLSHDNILMLTHWFDQGKLIKPIYTYLHRPQNMLDEALQKKYANILCNYSHNGLPSVNRAVLTDMLVFDLHSQENYIGDSEKKRTGATLLKTYLYEKNLFDVVEVLSTKFNADAWKYFDNLLPSNVTQPIYRKKMTNKVEANKTQQRHERGNTSLSPIFDSVKVTDTAWQEANHTIEPTTADLPLGFRTENKQKLCSKDKNAPPSSPFSSPFSPSSPFLKKQIFDYLHSPSNAKMKNLFSEQYDLDDVSMLLDEVNQQQENPSFTACLDTFKITSPFASPFACPFDINDINIEEFDADAYLKDYSPSSLEQLHASSLIFATPSNVSPASESSRKSANFTALRFDSSTPPSPQSDHMNDTDEIHLEKPPKTPDYLPMPLDLPLDLSLDLSSDLSSANDNTEEAMDTSYFYSDPPKTPDCTDTHYFFINETLNSSPSP